MNDKASRRERRSHRRVSSQINVKINGAATPSGATKDVSEGGAAVVVDQALAQGDRIEVELLLAAAIASPSTSDAEAKTTAPPETGRVKTMATVMWSAETDSGAFTAGIQFDGPSAGALERLRRFVAEHDE